MSLPHYIYPLKNVYDIMVSPDNFGVGVISREEFADVENANSIYSVRFNDRTRSLNQQATGFRELLHDRGVTESEWIDIMNNKRARMAWASITGLQTMSVPVPAAMFLLCCLIIGIMIWRMIRSESVKKAQYFRRAAFRYKVFELFKPSSARFMCLFALRPSC